MIVSTELAPLNTWATHSRMIVLHKYRANSSEQGDTFNNESKSGLKIDYKVNLMVWIK